MKQTQLLASAAFFLLFLLPLAAGFTDIEDFASVNATVVGFEPGTGEGSFVKLRIDSVETYLHLPGSYPPALEPNSTYTLGLLWGHKPMNGAFIELDLGSRITANISLHYNFTSHVGHLYGYELICDFGRILTDEGCSPESCANNEVLVGIECVPLNCGPSQGFRNHTCYDLECETDEKIEDHRCKSLACADDEFAANHFCQKLDCGLDKVARNHQCVPMFCGVFKKADNHACVIDWTQLAVFIIVTFIVLYLIYILLIQDLVGERKKGERALANRMGIFLVFIVSLTILVLPMAARLIFHGILLPGSESYHSQLISRMLMEGTLKFSFGGEANIYHLLLAYLGGVLGLDTAARLLPILLGTFSATLFYLIMRKILNDVRTSTLTTMILVFSPAYLYLFSISTPDCLIALLILAGAYLSLSSRRLSVISGGILLSLVSSYNPFVFALSFSAFLLVMLNTKNNRATRLALLSVITFVGIYSSIFLHDYSLPIESFRANLINQSIIDFGGKIGFGLFQVILLFSGLSYTWAKKRDYVQFYIVLALLFALMLALDVNYNAYLNFIGAYLIGLAISRFAETKWEAPQLKNIALLILFCGLLFSTVSYAKRVSMMEPDSNLEGALTKLSGYPSGVVLAHHTYYGFIEYFSGMPAYVGPEGADASMRLNITNEIFYSRRLEYTSDLMEKNHIHYIVIDRSMRQGLVWEREDQGLLFLLENSPSFRKLYGWEADVEVWEYLPQSANQSGLPEK